MSAGKPGRDADRFERAAVPVQEALMRVLAAARPVGTESLPLAECCGRRAAAAVRAADPVPHFRRSGMDGYAVSSASLAQAGSASPVRLRVAGSIACGEAPAAAVGPETAMRIMTGAMMPDGADAVVMLEMTEQETVDGTACVVLKRPVAPGANVSGVGSDIGCGETVVRRGTLLGPAHVAALAAVGASRVQVFRKPRIAIIPTGSELLAVSAPLEPGKIRNSNVYMLAAQAADAGAEARIRDSVPDTLDAVSRAIYDGLDSCDAVLTTGGVSVGDYDVVADFLRQWDGALLFNKVQMRPGSVTSAGVRGGKLLLALSGNPGACFAGFELFARPMIKAMQADERPEPGHIPAALAEPFPKVNAYPRYVRGTCRIEGGRLVAAPTGRDQSDKLRPGLGADCFLVIPPGGTGLPQGAEIEVVLFGGARAF